MKLFTLSNFNFFRLDRQIMLLVLSIFLIFNLSNEFSQAQVDWTRYGNNPVLDVGPPGAWDDNLLVRGAVYFDDTTYHMWYSGGDGANFRIGYATSPDGITWEKNSENPVLDLGDPGEWDDRHVVNPTVIYFNSQYHMFYQGYDGEFRRIGHATSPDGINWEKDTLHNPVIDVGPPGSWYDEWVATPFVMSNEDTLHLWFYGRHGTIGRIGHAFSTDEGTSWDLNLNNPVLDIGIWDSPRVSSPCVVYNSITSKYYMIYSGGNEGTFNSEIGYATSTSLYGPWEKQFGGPIFLKGDPGEWDSKYVGFHYVIFDQSSNTYKMWYTGGATDWEGKIGLATAPIVLSVPGDYSTIQAAIDAANNGNLVLVADGTYYENINYRGKAITVASHFLVDGDSTHIENTIIDGSQPTNPDSASVVTFDSGEDTTSILCGFTLTGGAGNYSFEWDDRGGGGIFLDSSGAKICNNIIEFNSVTFNGFTYGGGIIAFSVASHNLIIHDNLIQNNSVNGSNWATGGGIAVFNDGETAFITNNKFINNTVYATQEARGGGIDVRGPINEVQILNNIVKGNSAYSGTVDGGGGISIYECTPQRPVVNNNIVVGNHTDKNGGGILINDIGDESINIKNKRTAILSQNNKVQDYHIFINNTIVNNHSEGFGGAICITGTATNYIMNTIMWGNSAPVGPQFWGSLQGYYSDVEGGIDGTGNISLYPEFVDTVNGNYRLQDNISPCLQTGIDSIDIGSVKHYCPPFCINGVPRPFPTGTNPDIGACENPILVGVHNNMSLIPDQYSLSQNFPNPFNPSTKINYSIPQSSNVVIKVFDILGNEIETLVNEEKQIGTYEITWYVENLPSGVYFYRIQAGDFVETKKMVLMK